MHSFSPFVHVLCLVVLLLVLWIFLNYRSRSEIGLSKIRELLECRVEEAIVMRK